MRLKNKIALITGGNSGIGLATARVFIAEGAKVVITGRNRETLDAAQKELGPNALALQADVTDIAATEAAIKQGSEKFGKFDILFGGEHHSHPQWIIANAYHGEIGVRGRRVILRPLRLGLWCGLRGRHRFSPRKVIPGVDGIEIVLQRGQYLRRARMRAGVGG